MRAYSPKVVATKVVAGSAILAAWLACQSASAVPFANYLRFVRTSPTTLDALFVPGPHPAEFGLPAPLDPPLPGWDANVMASVVTAGGPPVLDESTLLLHVPVNNTFTLNALDSMSNALGTLTMLAVGSFPIDLNAGNSIVDEAAGTIRVQLGGTLLQGQPAGIFSVQQATGIYATDVLVVGESYGHQGGYWLFPLDDDPNTSLQQNILNAWDARQRIGEEIRAVITGHYVPEPSTFAMILVSVLAARSHNKPRRLLR